MYVGKRRSSTSARAPAEEFDTLLVESEDVECGLSEADNAGRKKELEALMAVSEDK